MILTSDILQPMLRRLFFKWAIHIIERDLLDMRRESLTEEQSNGLLAGLWDNPAFRNYIADRNAKLVHTIAGVAGEEPEPRDKARLMYGQRVENLILAAKAKACAFKRDEQVQAKKEKTKVNEG